MTQESASTNNHPNTTRDSRRLRISNANHQQLHRLATALGEPSVDDALGFALQFTADRVNMPTYLIENSLLLSEVQQLEQRLELLVLGNLDLLEAIKTLEASGLRGLLAAVNHYRRACGDEGQQPRR
jgi:hypothetical protein